METTLRNITSYIGIKEEHNRHVAQFSQRLSRDSKSLIEKIGQYADRHFDKIASSIRKSSTSKKGWIIDQVNGYLRLFSSSPSKKQIAHAIEDGRHYVNSGIDAIFMVGIYEIFLEHAESLIDQMDISDSDKLLLNRAVAKKILLDKMLRVYGYSQEAQRISRQQSSDYAHLYKLYATLGKVSIALLHPNEIGEIYQSFCDAAVQSGFAYAWVVTPEEDQDLLGFAAEAGKSNINLIRKQKISCSEDSPWGKGPTGTALRSGEMQVINDVRDSAILIPWQGFFQALEVRSMVAIPLKIAGKTEACFSLYSDEADFFGQDEMMLVRIMSREIGYALERLKAIEAHCEIGQELERQRQHDTLTGLPTRNLFINRLHRMMRDIPPGADLAVILISIDHFQEINNHHGHATGDDVVSALSEMISERIGENDLLGRTGSNIFSLATQRPGWLIPILSSLLKRLVLPRQILDQRLQITASIGAVMSGGTANANELLRLAGIALDHAKQRGGNQLCMYDQALDSAIKRRETIQSGIREALKQRNIIPFFQPKIDLATGAITGVEALARWQAGAKVMAPGEFLPEIEHTKLMAWTDWAILNHVAEVIEAHPQAFAAIPSVAINLSSQTLLASDFTPRLARLLHEHGIAPAKIELEILETVAIQDPHIISNIAACKALGCQIAIDDFGTAASSLVHLQEIPANTIKIDQSFTRNIVHNRSSRAIVFSLVAYTQQTGQILCAEGIENHEIKQVLLELGCPTGQGYGIARPMSLQALLDWCLNNKQSEEKTAL